MKLPLRSLWSFEWSIHAMYGCWMSCCRFPVVHGHPHTVEMEENASLVHPPAAVDTTEKLCTAVGVITPEAKGPCPVPSFIENRAIPELVVLWVKCNGVSFTGIRCVRLADLLVWVAFELCWAAEGVHNTHMVSHGLNCRHEHEECQRCGCELDGGVASGIS